MLPKKQRSQVRPKHFAGWFEFLLCLDTKDVLQGEDEINLNHYMRVGACPPVSEFYGIYDVYESTLVREVEGVGATTSQYGLPRPLQEYDIVAAFIFDADTKVVTSQHAMLLIKEEKNLHLLKPNTRLQYRPERELAGYLLERKIPSMRKKP